METCYCHASGRYRRASDEHHFENAFRSVEVIGWTTLGFGGLLPRG